MLDAAPDRIKRMLPAQLQAEAKERRERATAADGAHEAQVGGSSAWAVQQGERPSWGLAASYRSAAHPPAHLLSI